MRSSCAARWRGCGGAEAEILGTVSALVCLLWNGTIESTFENACVVCARLDGVGVEGQRQKFWKQSVL